MKTVVAAALGECVHVAGVSRFLQLAEEAGWRTVFLGPATPIEAVLAAVAASRAHGLLGYEACCCLVVRLRRLQCHKK